MKGILAVAAREIREKRAVLIAAAVAAVIPLLAPLVPAFGRLGPDDVRVSTALIMAIGLTVVLSLFLGATVVGRDLAENRLGFYLARPLSTAAIWWGKLLSAWLLALGCELVILLPAALVSGRTREVLLPAWPFPESALLLWIGPLALILMAHAVGVAWRARTLWLALDAVAVPALVAAILWLGRPFFLVQAVDVVRVGLISLFTVVVLALAAAGAVQVAVGRSDLRRGHAALSLTLWITLAGALLISTGWSHWARTPVPGDLARVESLTLGSGDWIALSGPSSGRFDFRPRFLLDVDTGRSLRIGAVHHGWWRDRHVVFSEDAAWAAWLEPTASSTRRVVRTRLDASVLHREPTAVELRDSSLAAISNGGDRLAMVGPRALSVLEAATGNLLAAVPRPARTWSIEMRFLTHDRLRVSAREWRESYESVSLSGELLVADRRMELVEETTALPPNGVLLADGRRVRIASDLDDLSWLEVLDPNGSSLACHPLGEPDRVLLGGEAELGRVVVCLLSSEGPVREWSEADLRTLLVDVDSGEMRNLPGAGMPVLSWLGRDIVDRTPEAPRTGTIATRLLLGPGRSLLAWDPERGSTRRLIPGPD